MWSGERRKPRNTKIKLTLKQCAKSRRRNEAKYGDGEGTKMSLCFSSLCCMFVYTIRFNKSSNMIVFRRFFAATFYAHLPIIIPSFVVFRSLQSRGRVLISLHTTRHLFTMMRPSEWVRGKRSDIHNKRHHVKHQRLKDIININIIALEDEMRCKGENKRQRRIVNGWSY